MRAKYRIAVINEETLGEKWHIRLSLLNLVLLFNAIVLTTLVVFGMLIWFTPLRNYLPGNTQGLREELVEQNAVVDSLREAMSFHQEYLGVIRGVVAGDVKIDSVKPLDSLYITRREELLNAAAEVSEQFMADYEAQAEDNLTLFDQALQNDMLQTLHRPAPGLIVRHFAEFGNGIVMQTPDKATVSSVMNGVVVRCDYVIGREWVVVVQHDGGYLSSYARLQKTVVTAGQSVSVAEALGVLSAEHPLQFELWRQGKAVDPETVIAF